MEKFFESPRGAFRLGRGGEDHPSLQAWDAADELALRWIAARLSGSVPAGELSGGGPQDGVDFRGPLILNDSFGALALGLADLGPAVVTDSFLSERAIRRNWAANGAGPEEPSISSPLDDWKGPVSFAVVKIPKTLSLLGFELGKLKKHLCPDAFVLGAGMTKEIHRSTLDLFETLLGPAATSLAAKKARLVFCRPRAEGISSGNRREAPAEYPKTLKDDESGLSFVVHAGVFSSDGVDEGTRLLLRNLPRTAPERVVDLGCGSGLLGLAAALRFPGAVVDLVDESRLAVEAARLTFRLNGIEERGSYHWGGGLEELPGDAVDLVLCNPPFHGKREISHAAAFSMFREAVRVLKPGGELRLVANRHLGYRTFLASLFGDRAEIIKSVKFSLYFCKKRRPSE